MDMFLITSRFFESVTFHFEVENPKKKKKRKKRLASEISLMLTKEEVTGTY